jgi:hypothetical protein
MPGSPGTPFAELEKQEAWQEHRREMDRSWQRLAGEVFPAMRDFQSKELSGPPIENAAVFYPFSGPDALTITTFFPRNATYVMVAMEPTGTLPTVKQFAGNNLGRKLELTQSTVYSLLHRSFFITRDMDRQFRGQVTDGLLPAILHLLVRTGHTVTGYRYVRLDDRGQVIERPAGYRAPGSIGNKGVEVDFVTAADNSPHRLFYFSVNVSDQKMRENQPFLAFLATLKGMATFFKATSYMTHKPEFSLIREQVLQNSAAVLQDDSGIPYRFFSHAAPWRIQLYGDYIRPYGSFRWLEQPDLRKAYLSTGPKPLAFRIGYGYSRVPSNLLLARRSQ